MTIASEITRLQGAKADARTSIISKGVNVPSNAKVDTYHNYIDQIESVNNSPVGITGSQTYGGLYTVGNYDDVSGLDGNVSYMAGDIVLIGYIGNWDDYDNYEQKDYHFVRWKKGYEMKSVSGSMGEQTDYNFVNQGLYLTVEDNGASYLFTGKAKYDIPNSSDWRFRIQVRYTVSTDTFTVVGINRKTAASDPRPDTVNDDMGLYNTGREKSRKARVALFTLKNT